MENKLFLWLYIFLPLVAFIVVLFIIDLIYKDKFEKQKETDFKENLTSDATGEPHVIRHIEGFERNILINEHKKEYQIIKLNHYITPLFVVTVLAIAYIGYKYQNWDTVMYIFIMVASVFGAYYYRFVRENNLDKDLRSPVFAIKGQLLKTEKIGYRESALKTFLIRGIGFNDQENSQINKYWGKWEEGIMLYVEYSPFTKHIWKIEKVLV